MSYLPFQWSAMQACPKCGKLDTHHVRYQGLNKFDGGLADEWLQRSCTRCWYEWKEAVIS